MSYSDKIDLDMLDYMSLLCIYCSRKSIDAKIQIHFFHGLLYLCKSYNLHPILWISFTMCSMSSLLGFGTACNTILKKLASPLYGRGW